MGEKKNGEQTENKNGGKNNVSTVVLKADLHCDGCASKVLKCIRNFDGVETATIGEGLITVAGKIDPAKLRGKVEQKTHKRVELISPAQPKKDNNNGENIDKKEKKKENNNGENNKENVKAKENNGSNKKTKETKPPVTTAVMKVHLHCEGCIHKISKIITKTKGYEDMKIDRQKELVTVTGAIDMKALASVLKKHLKKDVEVLPPEKKAEKKETKGGGGDKEKNEKIAGDEKKKKKNSGGDGGGGDGVAGGGGGGERKMEENRMQVHAPNPNPNPFVYAPGGEQFYYNPYAVGPYHAPQIFSDENPNACVVM